jgi:hypothetical protein
LDVSAVFAGAICANASELVQIMAAAAMAANVLDIMTEYLPSELLIRECQQQQLRQPKFIPAGLATQIGGVAHNAITPQTPISTTVTLHD